MEPRLPAPCLYKYRPSTSQRPLLNPSSSTSSTHQALGTAKITAACSYQDRHPLPTAPSKLNSLAMSPNIDGSPTPTPSSAGSLSAPPNVCTEAAPSTSSDLASTPKLAPNSGLDAPQHGGRSPSPTCSVKSYSSTGSKKRSHVDDGDSQTAMAPIKRVKKATSKAASKPTLTAPSMGTRSSGRARKAPERFTDLLPPPKEKAAPVRRMAGSKVYEAVFITTNSNSRLKKTDVFHMLLEPTAWTCLTPEQKLEILALLPSNYINVKLVDKLRSGTALDDARPREFNINFNLFRTDVAKFKEDLENGHLCKTWQASAEQAMVERAEGKFDDWKEQQSQLWWGQN